MNINYFHRNYEEMPLKDRMTFAIELPTKQQLLDVVNKFKSTIVLDYGFTYVHPKDQYSKPIGREIAKKAMVSQTFFFVSAKPELYSIVFEFTDRIRTIRFSVVENSDRVYMIDVAEIGENY